MHILSLSMAYRPETEAGTSSHSGLRQLSELGFAWLVRVLSSSSSAGVGLPLWQSLEAVRIEFGARCGSIGKDCARE